MKIHYKPLNSVCRKKMIWYVLLEKVIQSVLVLLWTGISIFKTSENKISWKRKFCLNEQWQPRSASPDYYNSALLCSCESFILLGHNLFCLTLTSRCVSGRTAYLLWMKLKFGASYLLIFLEQNEIARGIKWGRLCRKSPASYFSFVQRRCRLEPEVKMWKIDYFYFYFSTGSQRLVGE